MASLACRSWEHARTACGRAAVFCHPSLLPFTVQSRHETIPLSPHHTLHVLLLSSLLAAGSAVAQSINIKVKNGVMTEAKAGASPNRYYPDWGKNIGEINFIMFDAWSTVPLRMPDRKLSIKLSSEPQVVELKSPTGKSTKAEIRLTAVYVLVQPNNLTSGPIAEWVPPGQPAPFCDKPYHRDESQTDMGFTFKPTSGQRCEQQPAASLSPSAISSAYVTVRGVFAQVKLSSASINTLQDGTYAGKVTYAIGEGKDLDFGSTPLSPIQSKTFDITLTAESDLKVFAPFRYAVLAPPNNDWKRVSAATPISSVKLPLYIQSRGPFSVTRRCSNGTASCELLGRRGGEQHAMGITVEVGVPGTFTATNGSVYQDAFLIQSHWGAGDQGVTVTPTKLGAMTGYVKFHALNTPELRQQIQRGGIIYRGTVTLMFDKVLE